MHLFSLLFIPTFVFKDDDFCKLEEGDEAKIINYFYIPARKEKNGLDGKIRFVENFFSNINDRCHLLFCFKKIGRIKSFSTCTQVFVLERTLSFTNSYQDFFQK